MSNWLDGLLGRVLDAGALIPLGYGLNFVGGVRARLNTSNKFVEVDLRDDSIAVTHLAPEDVGAAPTFVLRIPMTAAAAGTADDVTGDAAPVACRIIDRWADITTAIAATALTVRDAAGGLGNTLSGTISSAATGEGIRANSGSVSDKSVLAAGEIPRVRRSDRGVAGTVYMLCERT